VTASLLLELLLTCRLYNDKVIGSYTGVLAPGMVFAQQRFEVVQKHNCCVAWNALTTSESLSHSLVVGHWN
jgi:hypothetical protein